MQSRNPGRLLALPANNGLGWKDLPATNALAYYEQSYIKAVLQHLAQGPVLSNFNLQILLLARVFVRQGWKS